MVSRSHGLAPAASADPPQRSTTVSPSATTLSDAPTSPCFVQFSAKASLTRPKRALQVPWMSMAVVIGLPLWLYRGRSAIVSEHVPHHVTYLPNRRIRLHGIDDRIHQVLVIVARFVETGKCGSNCPILSFAAHAVQTRDLRALR